MLYKISQNIHRFSVKSKKNLQNNFSFCVFSVYYLQKEQ